MIHRIKTPFFPIFTAPSKFSIFNLLIFRRISIFSASRLNFSSTPTTFISRPFLKYWAPPSTQTALISYPSSLPAPSFSHPPAHSVTVALATNFPLLKYPSPDRSFANSRREIVLNRGREIETGLRFKCDSIYSQHFPPLRSYGIIIRAEYIPELTSIYAQSACEPWITRMSRDSVS